MPPPFSSTNYDIINIGSAEIVNRSIKGIDIELATIDISNLSASCIASLSLLSRPFGVIRIINQSLAEDNFDYELSVFNAVSEEYDILSYAIKLKKNNSFSHFYQAANNLTNMKLIVSGSGVSVDGFYLNQGVEEVDIDGNELTFKIGSSTNYQNIEIGVAVIVV
jgi:hypothetical protein